MEKKKERRGKEIKLQEREARKKGIKKDWRK